MITSLTPRLQLQKSSKVYWIKPYGNTRQSYWRTRFEVSKTVLQVYDAGAAGKSFKPVRRIYGDDVFSDVFINSRGRCARSDRFVGA